MLKPVFESKLNILLSELLNQMGVVSHSEHIGQGRKDVIVYHQGLAIVLEGSYDKQDAENDAKKRIEQLAADVAIAVHYPKTFLQELTEGEIKSKLQEVALPVRVIIPEDISATLFRLLYQKNVIAKPIEDWFDVNLNSLATLIKETAQFIISEESIKETEDDVSNLIEDTVAFLSSHPQSRVIAKNIYDVLYLYKLYGFSIGDPVKIKEAIFAQSILATLLSSIYYESIRYAYKLDSLETLTKATSPQQALEKATHDILGINYEPIFVVIRDMLKTFPPAPLLFGKLVQLAVQIASKRTLLRRDLAGKVYHKVVGDWSLKKGLATFYTEIPSAYLLLYLAKPKLSRIADFACGSGTLLVAAYSATNAQHRLALLKSGVDKHPKEIESNFHTEFMNSCYAFDVLGYATQITALNLSLHSPETPISEFSSIYTMPLGYRKEDQSISLGSLELARFKLEQTFGEVTKTGLKKTQNELMKKLLDLEPFDLIAMNPPFTRTTGRGGKAGGGLFGFMTDEAVRQKVLEDYTKLREQAREKLEDLARKLLKNSDLEILLKDKEFRPYGSIWQAGEGLLFLYLADMRLKETGKLCFVLPKGLLSGISWFLARVLLAAKYHVEYVVVSYEAGNYNFSESTSLSECLIVAQKTEEHWSNEETTFVILLRKPKTSVEAIALANRIEAKDGKYLEAGEAKAFCLSVKRSELLENLDNWGRFVFLPHIKILDEIEHILDGALRVGNLRAEIPLTRLNNLISSIGVDAHRFMDTFKTVYPLTNMFEHAPVPGSVRILHGGEEAQRRVMITSPNAYAIPIIDRGYSLFQEIAGNLIVPDRIRVDTAHVISMYSPERLISNIFYAVRLKSEKENRLKALCLWFNTTWGILTVLSSREETHGGFIRLKMSQWRLLPVLDIDRLSEDKIKALAAVFDKFKNKELARIPDQYGLHGEFDKLRIELDCAFLDAIGIHAKESALTSLYSDIGASLGQWMGH